jgi:acyl-CoA thioesterase I
MLAGPVRADAPVVLVVGDSLSAAYGIDSRAGWVALLSDRLGEAGFPHRVINSSMSGDTTSSGVQRLPRTLEQHDPSVVILELGGNDGLRGYPVADIRANLASMIEASQDAGAAVIIVSVTIPPNYGRAYRTSFRTAYDELATEYGLPIVSFDIEEVAGQPGMLQDDGIHPTAAAQPMMMERIWCPLERVLRAASNRLTPGEQAQ